MSVTLKIACANPGYSGREWGLSSAMDGVEEAADAINRGIERVLEKGVEGAICVESAVCELYDKCVREVLDEFSTYWPSDAEPRYRLKVFFRDGLEIDV
jgi:hypothetical protein